MYIRDGVGDLLLLGFGVLVLLGAGTMLRAARTGRAVEVLRREERSFAEALSGPVEQAQVALGALPTDADAAIREPLRATLQGCDRATHVVEQLLAKGANPNAKAPNHTTPLMFAARNGHEEVVVRLLKAGVDLDSKNDQNETAESWALKNRNTE